MMLKLTNELENCIKNKKNFLMKIAMVNHYYSSNPLDDWNSGNRSMDVFEHWAIENFIYLVKSKKYNCSYELCYHKARAEWPEGEGNSVMYVWKELRVEIN